MLCPTTAAARPTAPPPPAASRPAPTSPGAASPGAAFQVGQEIEARYGSQWIRGKVTRIVTSTTARGVETQYEVVLDNRKRGTVPASWVRPIGG